MKRRILTALLAVCLVIALGTVGAFADGEVVATIGTEEHTTLGAAIDAAEASTEDVVINLLANVSETIDISKNEGSITIDLGGKTIETGRLNLKKGQLTIQNGTLKPASGVTQPLNVYGASTDAANSVLNIASNVKIKDAQFGICLFDYGAKSGQENYGKGFGAVINFNGKIESTVNGSNGIFVSGNLGNTDASGAAIANAAHPNVININSGSVINVTGDQGIAMNGQAIVNVSSGASITGREAIGVKRGVLNISGGTFVGNGANAADPVTANDNGTEASGAAISVTSTYNKYGSLEINITGGDFTSEKSSAVYVGHSKDSDGTTNAYVKGFDVSISDGTFKTEATGEGASAVFIAEKYINDANYNDKVITGGKFLKSDNTASKVDKYLIDGLDIDDDGSVIVGSDAVAMIGNTPYISFDAALNAAKANDTIVVLDDKVELTGTITIDKALTIKGNGSNVIEITAPSTSRGKALSLTASLTLDNMDLTIKGSGAEGAGLGDAIEVGESGTTTSVEFKAINGSKVTFRNLQNGFVLPAGENGKVTFTSSALDVSGVRGNLSNGGVWTLNSADVDVNGGDYALSVYTLATTGTTDIDISNTDYGAIYAIKTINLGGTTTVDAANCGKQIPYTTSDYGHCYAPIQIRCEHKTEPVPAGAGITVGSGATVTVTGTSAGAKGAVYVVNDTGFSNLGTINGTVAMEDVANEYTVTLKDSNGQVVNIFNMSAGNYTLPTMSKPGYKFLGWTMNGGTTYYPANTSIAINADITFTAGWRGGLYDIAVTPSIYGTVTAYVNNAVVTGADLADLVYLKVTPVLGYKVKTISVSYTVGTTAYPVTVTAAPSTSVYDYYFSMPSNNVTVTVTYERDGMPFTDVHSWQWHYQAVYYVYSNELMEGTSATTFEPDAKMTRAMFWTVLARIDGKEITGTNWWITARNWAMEHGISDGTNPHANITRQEMVTMLWRFAGTPSTTGTLIGYLDKDKVASWAETAMRWAVGNDIINGVTAVTLDPNGQATRAQCAQIFLNAKIGE